MMEKPTKSEPVYKTLKNNEGPAYMVEFRKVTGEAWALPYTLLSGIMFNPSGELRLSIGDFQITVKGRKLRAIFDPLQLHRVTMIREVDQDHELGDQTNETVVTEIVMQHPESDPDNPPSPFLLPG